MSKVKTSFIRFLSSRKYLLILLIIVLAIGYLVPLMYMGDAQVKVMERNLMNLDLARSTFLYLFDSTLLAFSIFAPILILLNVAGYNKLKKMKPLFLIAFLLTSPIITLSSHSGNIETNLKQEKPLAKYVFIITLDGTRADVFWSVNSFIKSKLNESVYADHIVTVYPTVTYPGHISLLTGTWPQIHGTENNPSYGEFGTRPYSSYLRSYHKPRVDDILDLASKHGYLTAVFAAPPTMATIIGGENTYRVYGKGSEGTINSTIGYLDKNYATIRENGLVAFIHLVDTDSAGHRYGSDSFEYRKAIRDSISLVERLYNKLSQLGLLDDSIIVVTADHGMYGNKHHNVYPPLVSDIPLWMWGKPFKKGYKLGGGRIVDIAPTLYYILGIPKPNYVTGVTLYTALNDTYIESIRGESVNLEAMEKNEIKWAMGLIYKDIVLWYTIVVIMIWILIALLVNLLTIRKRIRREVGKKNE